MKLNPSTLCLECTHRRSVHTDDATMHCWYVGIEQQPCKCPHFIYTVRGVQTRVRGMGLSCGYKAGEYRINYHDGKEPTAYYTNDAQDAIAIAKTFLQRRVDGVQR